MKVGILNVTGYAGMELARILARHPEVEIVGVTGRSEVGNSLGAVYPHLASLGLPIVPEISGSVDLVFSALPHKASAAGCLPFLQSGVKVIDISGDFRLRNVAEYQEWHGIEHPCPEYLEEAVYGLPEIHKKAISESNLVANPGCYPTSAILALAPAVDAGLVEGRIIIDSKSGVSGAGRGLSLGTHFSEVNESVSAYALGGHFHLPEITQELNLLNPQEELRITFQPHLIPMTRGILSTCYAPLKNNALPNVDPTTALRSLYAEFYLEEPFVKLADTPPATKHTLGNNDCIVYPVLDREREHLLIISCIDNLTKGAASQAVQNMNIMFGIPEVEGLEALALYP